MILLNLDVQLNVILCFRCDNQYKDLTGVLRDLTVYYFRRESILSTIHVLVVCLCRLIQL